MENNKPTSEALKARIADRKGKKEKKAIKGLPEVETPQSRIIHEPQVSHGGKIKY